MDDNRLPLPNRSNATSKERSTVADRVYQVLRHEITHGVLKSGSSLIEDEIAERLGVSRTPVRDSMQRLNAERLVKSHRRRWMVVDHSPREIEEIYHVRAALESYAARLAAQSATEEEREILKQLSTQADEREIVARVEGNERFHEFIIKCSHNDRLAAARRDNMLIHFNYRLAGLYSESDLILSAQQHVALADAIAGGNGGLASDIAREHVENSLRILLRLPS